MNESPDKLQHLTGLGRKPRRWIAVVAAVAMIVVAMVVMGEREASAAFKFKGAWAEEVKFNGPMSIDFNKASNEFVVADTKNNRVVRITPAGGFVSAFGGFGNGNGQFHYPGSVATAADGSIFVADTENHRIQKFSSTGVFQLAFGGFGEGAKQFKYPRGLDVGPEGNIYVADSGNNRIQVFTPAGGFVKTWGVGGGLPGQFSNPSSITIGPTYKVFVADTNNFRIQRFDQQGTYILKWGAEGYQSGQLRTPSGIEVDGAGRVIVADTLNHRFQRFDPDGGFLDKWGSFGVTDGTFDHPSDLAFDPAGTIYAVDTYNNRVQKYVEIPDPPTKLTTDPSNSGSSLKLKVRGSVTGGNTVKVYTTPDCSGDPVAEGTVNLFKGDGLQVLVQPDSLNTFRATVHDDNVNETSPCSSDSAVYKHVPDPPPAPPAAPTALRVTPGSPGSSLNPVVGGNALAGSVVRLYATADCSGDPIAVGSAELFNGAGIPVAVAKGSVNTFRATATMPDQLTSNCSESSINYTQVTTCADDPGQDGCGGGGPEPPVKPTETSAVFDGTHLYVRLFAPSRFRPVARSTSVPLTARKGGKPMAAPVKRRIRPGKWTVVKYSIKPEYRSRLESMSTKDARLLLIKQTIRSKKLGPERALKPTVLLRKYRVRAATAG